MNRSREGLPLRARVWADVRSRKFWNRETPTEGRFADFFWLEPGAVTGWQV